MKFPPCLCLQAKVEYSNKPSHKLEPGFLLLQSSTLCPCLQAEVEYSNKPLPGAKPRWSPSHIKGLIGEPSLLLPVGRGQAE